MSSDPDEECPVCRIRHQIETARLLARLAGVEHQELRTAVMLIWAARELRRFPGRRRQARKLEARAVELLRELVP